MRTRWTITQAHWRAVREVTARHGWRSPWDNGWLQYRARMWWGIVKDWRAA